jgi:hypothetical protein
MTAFRMPAAYWMNFQSGYELYNASERQKESAESVG